VEDLVSNTVTYDVIETSDFTKAIILQIHGKDPKFDSSKKLDEEQSKKIENRFQKKDS